MPHLTFPRSRSTPKKAPHPASRMDRSMRSSSPRTCLDLPPPRFFCSCSRNDPLSSAYEVSPGLTYSYVELAVVESAAASSRRALPRASNVPTPGTNGAEGTLHPHHT
eukprot:scaffold102_cov340-Pavlova_lutheri.AAC.38